MALLCNPPLTEHERATIKSIAKACFGGPRQHVVNPEYLPDGQRAAVEPLLASWCERHEMRHWPSWVTQWHTEYTARTRRSVGRDARRAGEGMDGGAVQGGGSGEVLGGSGCDGATAESESEAAA